MKILPCEKWNFQSKKHILFIQWNFPDILPLFLLKGVDSLVKYIV
jgi:hypothetical protein